MLFHVPCVMNIVVVNLFSLSWLNNHSIYAQVPLYDESQVTLTRSVCALAQQSSTATSMTWTLLISMLDMQTLLTSSLKSGPSKRSGTKDSARLNKLDSEKLVAIYSRFESYFIVIQAKQIYYWLDIWLPQSSAHARSTWLWQTNNFLNVNIY